MTDRSLVMNSLLPDPIDADALRDHGSRNALATVGDVRPRRVGEWDQYLPPVAIDPALDERIDQHLARMEASGMGEWMRQASNREALDEMVVEVLLDRWAPEPGPPPLGYRDLFRVGA